MDDQGLGEVSNHDGLPILTGGRYVVLRREPGPESSRGNPLLRQRAVKSEELETVHHFVERGELSGGAGFGGGGFTEGAVEVAARAAAP